MPTEKVIEVHNEIQKLLDSSDVTEFKWNKLRNAKNRHCAQKFIDFVIENLYKYDLRIEILTWDTQDGRHNVHGRDDDANFERMYFKILKRCIERRKTSSDVRIYYDQKQGVAWPKLKEVLSQVGKRLEEKSYPLFDEKQFFKNYSIKEFREVDSEQCNATQISDLFAGLSVFSKEKYDKFVEWSKIESGQSDLFGAEEPSFSNKEKNRFPILHSFNSQAKAKKLSVSLASKKRLHTFKHSNPINFWLYEPQGEYDKAPIKK
jgi:hypothetical protein